VRKALAVVLFAFEPVQAATMLLRVGPTLLDRDALTAAGFAVRLALALASVAAAIGLQGERPFADRLAAMVLIASAAFAVVQYFTRLLPTSLAPDVAGLFTVVILLHHAAWLFALRRARASAQP
jgi:hypothetical protein